MKNSNIQLLRIFDFHFRIDVHLPLFLGEEISLVMTIKRSKMIINYSSNLSLVFHIND